MHIKIGSLIKEVAIEGSRVLEPGEEVEALRKPSVIAVDGERGELLAWDQVKVRLQRDGPRVVDIERTLTEAAGKGFFTDYSLGEEKWL